MNTIFCSNESREPGDNVTYLVYAMWIPRKTRRAVESQKIPQTFLHFTDLAYFCTFLILWIGCLREYEIHKITMSLLLDL